MPDFYFTRYLPLLIHIAIAMVIAVGMVLLSFLVGQHKYNSAKMSQYECGMQPVGDARQRFSVKFYLVAMLFILFDVEAIFLYPWAIVGRPLKADGLGGFWFAEMMVYIGIVLAGLWYVWKKGVIDWNKQGKAEKL
ncbi:MAG: NADH-quinone oxidoreductase subunit A [Acidobacteriota bacterium]|nr:NADH-quinone oxidoreductase subunit A [Acidobacteriota bacterium]